MSLSVFALAASAARGAGPGVGRGDGDLFPATSAIAAGLHICAIQAGTGAVVCWGVNDSGQATPPPSVNGTGGTASTIAAGSYHSCGIQAGTGAVVCWGVNDSGQATPPPSVDGTAGTASAISAGYRHSCAIQAGTGAIVCWGDNAEGQATPPHLARADEFEPPIPVARAADEALAHPEVVPDPPLDPGEPGDADLERAFEARVGAVLDRSAARAAERAMPLLDAREAERLDEVTRSAVRGVKQQLARTVERRLLDAAGEEATPPPLLAAHERGAEVYRPSVDGSAGTATAIAAGGNHSCAIQAGTGAVVCWGWTDFGQATPPPSVDGSAGTATAIAAGAYHSCAIQAGTSAVVCWGDNSYTQATPPPAVNGSSGTATVIAAGTYHSCAIQVGTRAVVCWGNDESGQATPPASVDGSAGTATATAAGSRHSCAIQAGTRAVVCWGHDESGQATPPASVDGSAGMALAIAMGGIPAAPTRGSSARLEDVNADGFEDLVSHYPTEVLPETSATGAATAGRPGGVTSRGERGNTDVQERNEDEGSDPRSEPGSYPDGPAGPGLRPGAAASGRLPDRASPPRSAGTGDGVRKHRVCRGRRVDLRLSADPDRARRARARRYDLRHRWRLQLRRARRRGSPASQQDLLRSQGTGRRTFPYLPAGREPRRQPPILPSRTDRRSVRFLDPLYRPIYILHPSLVIREYRGDDHELVEVANLRRPVRSQTVVGARPTRVHGICYQAELAEGDLPPIRPNRPA